MKVLFVGLLELRRLSRDPVALFFTALFPTLIILIIGVAIFGASGPAGVQGQLGVLDQGSGELGKQLVAQIKKDEPDLINISTFDDLDTVRKSIRRETIDAAIVLPRGYTDDLKAGKTVEVQFLAPTIDPSPVMRALLTEIIGDYGGRVRAAVFATKHGGDGFEENLVRAEEAAATPQNEITISTERLGQLRAEEELFSGFSYPAASNLVLFVFISSLAASGSFVESRLLGIPRRMLSTPTSSRTILGGVTLGRFVIAAFQGLLIFAVGAFVFGVDWGDPFGTAVLITVFALVGTSVGMLGGTLFRTPEQASSVGPPIGIALGMLGGCMWPLEIVPAPMRTAGHAFPHAWAMDGFIDLIGKGESIAGISTQLLVLGAFIVVLLPLGAWRLSRTLTG